MSAFTTTLIPLVAMVVGAAATVVWSPGSKMRSAFNTLPQGLSLRPRRAITEILSEAAWQRCYVQFLGNALD